MIHTRSGRLGCVLLLTGIAAASGQEREVAPLPSLAPLVERVAPAVVNISVTEIVDARMMEEGFGDPRLRPFLEEFSDVLPDEREGAGSGVIVDAASGYVLTNHHVISDASRIDVILTDNRSFEATVVGSDEGSDIAVLQIAADDLQAIPLASTRGLEVGDYVVAIGNPFGLGQTVTSGIVSALGRTSGSYTEGYENFIQTDASINVGNSGGALINLKGDLVGINSALVSRTGDSVGVGFAIPAEMAASVMSRLLEFGEVPRGLLGVNMDSVTPNFAADWGLAVDSGAWVYNVVPESAAEAAGIRIDDVIVGVDGDPIGDLNDLRNIIAMKLPGESVDVRVVRDGSEHDLTAVLDMRPDETGGPRIPREPAPRQSVLNGIEFTVEPGRDGGLRIISIERNNRLARNYLEPEDLIRTINREPVRDVGEALELTDDERTIVLELERDSRNRFVRLR